MALSSVLLPTGTDLRRKSAYLASPAPTQGVPAPVPNKASCYTLPSIFPVGRVNEDRWVAGAEVGIIIPPTLWLTVFEEAMAVGQGHQMSSQHARAEASSAARQYLYPQICLYGQRPQFPASR